MDCVERARKGAQQAQRKNVPDKKVFERGSGGKLASASFPPAYSVETVLIFAGLGLLAGALLTVSSKIFEIATDKRIEEVTAALPGINCGACGFAGCADYAEAAVKGESVNLCKPGGQEAADKIGAILERAPSKIVPQVAVVHCNGNCQLEIGKFTYKGIQSCKAADRFYSGSDSCSYGCLAFGDCVSVCPQDAIEIKDRLAKVDKIKCIGCGMCVKVCPGQLIRLRDLGKDYDVRCSSHDTGKIVRKSCKAGCIACNICEKVCPEHAITVTDNLAQINYDKCTSCGICAEKCPSKVIVRCS
jgi:Na+-translocating ferredoxin:NAD+ oxidoreductase RNF subunit RnfB